MSLCTSKSSSTDMGVHSAQPAEFGAGSRGGDSLSWAKNSFRKPTKEQSELVRFHHVSLEHRSHMGKDKITQGQPWLFSFVSRSKGSCVYRVSHILFPCYAIGLGVIQVLSCCVNHSSLILTQFSFVFDPWSNRVNLVTELC